VEVQQQYFLSTAAPALTPNAGIKDLCFSFSQGAGMGVPLKSMARKP
jgi:hypothetical protein